MSRVDPSKIIDRAATLIHDGYPQGQVEKGVWLCWSQRYGQERIYTVTADSCSCWMGQNRRSMVCKHRWSCVAPLCVGFVQELREASTMHGLELITDAYAPSIQHLDECFLEYARKEYQMKRDELQKVAA